MGRRPDQRSISRWISSSLKARCGWLSFQPWISRLTPQPKIGQIGQK
jgi:hypothetical protein